MGIKEEVLVDETMRVAKEIAKKGRNRIRLRKSSPVYLMGDGSPVHQLLLAAHSRARELQPDMAPLVHLEVDRVDASSPWLAGECGASRVSAIEARLAGDGNERVEVAIDANRGQFRAVMLDSLAHFRSLAEEGVPFRLVVGVAMPSIPPLPPGITGLSEREVSYYLECKVPRTDGVNYYLAIEKMCREIQQASEACRVSLVRFSNVYAPIDCQTPDVPFADIIDEAFDSGVVRISREDMRVQVGVTFVDSAASCLDAVAFSEGIGGRVFNFYDDIVSVENVKRTLFSCYSRHLAFEMDVVVEKGLDVRYATMSRMQVQGRKIFRGMDFALALKRLVSYRRGLPYDNSEHVAFYSGKLSVIQKLEIDILKEIDRICRKHGIMYFLAGGTLLGQRRYKGPIPWDDDLDIGMLRPDYEKFRKVCEPELSERFCYTSPYNDSGSHYTIDKVRIRDSYFSTKFSAHNIAQDGVFVDVLVYDQTSNCALLRNFQIFVLQALTVLLEIKWFNKARHRYHYVFSRLMLPIMRRIPFVVFHRIFDWVACWFSGSKKATMLIDTVGKKLGDGPLPFAGLEDVVYVDFAGIKAPIPVDPVPYLTYAYGPDFMTEPILSDRTCPHNFARIDLGGYVFGEVDCNFRPVNLNGELFE